jgi:hypothetical protein
VIVFVCVELEGWLSDYDYNNIQCDCLDFVKDNTEGNYSACCCFKTIQWDDCLRIQTFLGASSSCCCGWDCFVPPPIPGMPSRIRARPISIAMRMMIIHSSLWETF